MAMSKHKLRDDRRVIPLREPRVAEHTPYYHLANDVGMLKLTVEKLIYRVQQTERRHKDLIRENRALYSEIKKLRTPKDKATTPKKIRRPASPPPAIDVGLDETPPDIDCWAALDELNDSG